MSGIDGGSSSIEWYDSPKFVTDNVSTLRSQLAGVKRTEAEQKFNDEFDRWFAVGNEGNGDCSSRGADATSNDDLDVTPPVLRMRYRALRPHASEAPSCSPAGFSNNDSDVDNIARLIEILKEAKRIFGARRRTVSGSSSPRMHSLDGAQVKAIACVVKGEDVANESNLSKEEPRISEVEVQVIGKSSCSSGSLLKSDALDPLMSSHIDTSVGGGVSQRIFHFEKGDQEPSPIISVTSRKRKRKNPPEIVVRKGGGMEVSTSSDEDIGPMESTPFPSRRASIVGEQHIEKISVSSLHRAEGEEGTAYDSMDDEAVNVLLSQMPIEPQLHLPETTCSDSNDARPLPENIIATQSFQKDSYAVLKPKICVTKKVCATTKICNERTPLRRCRTSDALPQSDIKTGGWSRRMTAVIGGSGARREKADEGGDEAMPRNTSSETEMCDSFCDDDDFEGVDFSAIDAVQ